MFKRVILSAFAAGSVLFATAEDSSLFVERFAFRTTGNDCYADGSSVLSNECYALVWKRNGSAVPFALPMNPPNPNDPFALGDDLWLARYFPIAERIEGGGVSWSHCPEVLFEAGDIPVDESTNGTWTVCLLDTRYPLPEGGFACGFDRTVTNAPRRINAYVPIAGLTDIKLSLTRSPLVGKDLTGGSIETPTVANQATEALKCHIVFNVNAVGGICDEPSREVVYGNLYGELPGATLAGYTFVGWFTAATGGTLVTAATAATSNATLFAVWSPNDNTVTFDGNGGTPSEVSRIVKSDAKLGKLPTAARQGYAFDGWFTAREKGEEVSADTGVKADVTYYAQWTANKYEVSYDSHGGSGTMDPQPMTWDVEEALASNLFTRAGYTFLGWTDDETELEEVLYYDGVVVSNLTAEADGQVTLYAIWKRGVCTITFDACGGDVKEQVRCVNKGESVGALPTAELENHRFLGWFTAPEGGEAATAETVVMNNRTFYAQWAEFDPGDPKSDWLKIRTVQGDVSLGIGEPVGAAEEYFTVDSGSALKSVKVSGLPSGVTFKFTAAKGEKPAKFKLAGKAKKKGMFYVTVTAANANKFRQTRVMKFSVGGAASDEKDGIGEAYGIDFSVLSNLVAGTTLQPHALLLPSDWKIAAKGLPTGLKVLKSCATDASGVVCDAVQGTPTKPGKFTVTFTMKDLKNPRVTLTTKMNVIVGDPGSRYITIVAEDGGSARTKSGVYAAGSALKLSAKAAKKSVFVGWQNDIGALVCPTAGADYRATSLSLLVGETMSTRFTACFRSSADDRDIAVTAVGFDGEKDGVTDVLVCRTAAAPQDFWFKVDSLSLPTISVKGLPSGISFAGVKDIALGGEGMAGCLPDEQYYRIRVKNGSKLKPGVYAVKFNVGNASQKQAVVKIVTIEVPNFRSGLYEGQLNYDKDAYPIVAGICDLTKYPAFNLPENAKVSVKGLPAGIKFDSKRKTFTGVATKTGNFTVTITTTVGKTKYVDTVTLSVSGLPARLAGTFNGQATNEVVMATEAVKITASAVGKITAKVGTVSLSKTGWDSFEDGVAVVRLVKSSGKGQTAATNTLDLCVNTNGWWMMHVDGSYSVCGSQDADYGVFAQRNPYGKFGRGYENEEAHEIADWLSKQRSNGKFKICAAEETESGVWRLDEAVGGTVTVQVKDTGAVKVSGKLGGKSVSGSSVLMVLDEDLLAADFIIGKDAKKVVLSLTFEISRLDGTVHIIGLAQTAAE